MWAYEFIYWIKFKGVIVSKGHQKYYKDTNLSSDFSVMSKAPQGLENQSCIPEYTCSNLNLQYTPYYYLREERHLECNCA